MIVNYAKAKYKVIYGHWRIYGLTLTEARQILRELKQADDRPIPFQGEPQEPPVISESDGYF